MEPIYLDNFSILLDSFACNRNCPYCISRNNSKPTFKKGEDFNKLEKMLKEIALQNVHFKKITILGNGEPSLYSYNQLKEMIEVIIMYKYLFDKITFYTSGFVFNNTRIFNLFNDANMHGIDCEFVPLILSFDEKIDQHVLGYKVDYLSTYNFRKARNIKLDIALTKYINTKTFIDDIKDFLDANPNVKKVKFCSLAEGLNNDSKQSRWVSRHALSEEQVLTFKNLITEKFSTDKDLKSCQYRGTKFYFSENKEPNRFVVWSKNKLMNFLEEEISPRDIRSLYFEKRLNIYT